LREAWFSAPDLPAQQKIAAEIQIEAFASVPYIPLGQFDRPTAYRSTLSGVIPAPPPILWNVEKN
jgi:peptide/nickel transport system substrate-binding protein